MDNKELEVGKLYLVTVELLPTMVFIHQQDFLNYISFMVVENFYIKPIDQVQIYLVPVVPDVHNECTVRIQSFYLLLKA